MKRVYYYVIGAVALLGVTIGATWIGAVNGEVRRNQAVSEATGNVYAQYSGRYEKMGAVIDAIQSADAMILNALQLITDARTAFAAALDAGIDGDPNEQAQIVESTITSLVVLLEDNPNSYQTTNLYAAAIAEFSASTNSVTFSITSYNSAVTAYNTHIQVFPNMLFLGSKTPFTTWVVPTYSTTLPTFS